jgi:hypothetical protein
LPRASLQQIFIFGRMPPNRTTLDAEQVKRWSRETGKTDKEWTEPYLECQRRNVDSALVDRRNEVRIALWSKGIRDKGSRLIAVVCGCLSVVVTGPHDIGGWLAGHP